MLQREYNRPINDKKVDAFYTTFLRMDENTANILGRQVRRIDRPNITFDLSDINTKGLKVPVHNRISYSSATVEFADDDASLVIKALYGQAQRQANENSLLRTSFDITIKVYNAIRQVIEEYTYKQCVIESINHSQQVYDNSTDNTITVTFRYVDVEYKFKE